MVRKVVAVVVVWIAKTNDPLHTSRVVRLLSCGFDSLAEKVVVGGGKIVGSCVGPCKVLREQGNGGSISLCVGIQAKLLIVDDVMNGVFFFFVVVAFFSEKK